MGLNIEKVTERDTGGRLLCTDDTKTCELGMRRGVIIYLFRHATTSTRQSVAILVEVKSSQVIKSGYQVRLSSQVIKSGQVKGYQVRLD